MQQATGELSGAVIVSACTQLWTRLVCVRLDQKYRFLDYKIVFQRTYT